MAKRLDAYKSLQINKLHTNWSLINMNKFKKWFEPIGLALLLVSYGWQCFEEHSTQMKIEGYFYEINKKMLAIWEAVYDDALHSDRYDGKALSWVNYDKINKSIKDWGQVQKEM